MVGCSDLIMRPCDLAARKPWTDQSGKRNGRFVKSREDSVVVGSRPSGCPSRYCGCALSLKLFGRIIPRLNLAANWLAFPRASAASGMVAARRGHVFLLKQHISGSTWLVWDPNSGRHRTRLHARSIAGFKIVDPNGTRLAFQ